MGNLLAERHALLVLNRLAGLHEEMVQKHLRDSVESAEVEKRREHEERRKQAELNTKLEQLRATETLSQAAEQQLRKKWLESRDATTLEQIAHVESLRSAQKVKGALSQCVLV